MQINPEWQNAPLELTYLGANKKPIIAAWNVYPYRFALKDQEKIVELMQAKDFEKLIELAIPIFLDS